PGGGSHTAVLRYQDGNGTFMQEFSADTEAFEGITVGPDKRIYVTSNVLGYGSVLRFDRHTGAFIDTFINARLPIPGDLKFGPDGNLYVTSISFPASEASVLRFNGASGAFMDV